MYGNKSYLIALFLNMAFNDIRVERVQLVANSARFLYSNVESERVRNSVIRKLRVTQYRCRYTHKTIMVYIL